MMLFNLLVKLNVNSASSSKVKLSLNFTHKSIQNVTGKNTNNQVLRGINVFEYVRNISDSVEYS